MVIEGVEAAGGSELAATTDANTFVADEEGPKTDEDAKGDVVGVVENSGAGEGVEAPVGVKVNGTFVDDVPNPPKTEDFGVYEGLVRNNIT